MKTRHWQTKALILFIAAVALWLATGCGAEPTQHTGRYPYPGPGGSTPEALCGPDAPLAPSREYEEFLGRESMISLFNRDRMRRVGEARDGRLAPEIERVEEIYAKYRDIVARQWIDKGGYIYGYRWLNLPTETGLPSDKFVIYIEAEEYVDQDQFPPEDRIPDCMEDIEVHFLISPLPTIGG